MIKYQVASSVTNQQYGFVHEDKMVTYLTTSGMPSFGAMRVPFS